jgi:hypothetical protein
MYSLFTHDYMTAHDSNTIINFADFTTLVGPITYMKNQPIGRRSGTWQYGARTTTSPLTSARQRN